MKKKNESMSLTWRLKNEFDKSLFYVDSVIEGCSQENYVFSLPPQPPKLKRKYTKR
jgi:hypothetical protein